MIDNTMRNFKIKLRKIFKKKSYLDLLVSNGFKHGKNFKMYDCNIDFGHCWLIEVGDDVVLTNCTILAHDGSTKHYLGKSKIGRVIIGDRVFVGHKATILCGVTIGDDVIIGVNTVVTRDIPSNSVVVGYPGKIIGKTSDYISKHDYFMKEKPVYNTYWKNKTENKKHEIKKV